MIEFVEFWELGFLKGAAAGSTLIRTKAEWGLLTLTPLARNSDPSPPAANQIAYRSSWLWDLLIIDNQSIPWTSDLDNANHSPEIWTRYGLHPFLCIT